MTARMKLMPSFYKKLNRENCVCRMKMGLFAKIVLRKNFLTLEFLWFCDDFKENKG